VSNDGDYFRRHDDNTRGCAPTRAISYVYFFHREPRAFTGGELCLHAYPGELDAPETVAPAQNQLVLFSSSRPHEVSLVVCPSRAFADSRLTLNGWIHREGPRS
jgi:SM-20-related protein